MRTGPPGPSRRADRPASPVNGDPGLRVAIVGFGPRGLGCLERLAIEVKRWGPIPAAIHVTAHDPSPHPGASPPYAPGQPDSMLLNFPARHVDAWSEDNDLLAPAERLSLLDWLERFHPPWASGECYVPRRLLGAYLRDCAELLLQALPPAIRFHHVRGEVLDLEANEKGWNVRHADPTLDVEGVDEVMVATGHGTWRRDETFDAWARRLPSAPSTRRLPSVYPVETCLAPDALPGGSVVGVRGFGLTWIDATLAVTSGRGGVFEETGGAIPRYRASGGAEPLMVPFSRSGLPVMAKPGSDLVERSGELTTLWESLRQGIRGAEVLTPAGLVERMKLAGTRARVALGGDTTGPGPDRADPLRVMDRSVRVALGLIPPDAVWARGEAWRQAYPAVVDRCGEGGMAAAHAVDFARLTRALERYAYGPPPENLARMVALARAGHLDLRFVRMPRIREREGHLVLEARGAFIRLDVLLNAVTPPPGVHRDTPLLHQLLCRGHLRRVPGWRAVAITSSAEGVGSGGHPTPGLSVVGRATEGWVLGNDTLNRSLHEHTRRWARRILGPARFTEAKGAQPVTEASGV